MSDDDPMRPAYCPGCREEVAQSDDYCPHCGASVSLHTPRRYAAISDVPKENSVDRLYALAKAVASEFPAGGTLAEILGQVFGPPVVARQREFLEEIGKRLFEVEEEMEGLKVEELVHNEVFVTTLSHALPMATRIHQKQKREALRNAVLNSALPSAPEDDIQLMFLHFIDELTPRHLLALCRYPRRRDWTKGMGIHDIASAGLVEDAGEEGTELYEQICRDLLARGLVKEEPFPSEYGEYSPAAYVEPPTYPIVTALGRKFLGFIGEPNKATEEESETEDNEHPEGEE